MASNATTFIPTSQNTALSSPLSALFHPSITTTTTTTPNLPSAHHQNLILDAFSYLENSPLVPNDPSEPWPRPLGTHPNSHAAGAPATAAPDQFSGDGPPASTAASTAAPPQRTKKRPRASRRAPTTVLTTDASNFRAMVQEFTGIPSPPFTATVGAAPSSLLWPFARSRLDLVSSVSGGFRSSAVDPMFSLFAPKLPCVQSGNGVGGLLSFEALLRQSQQVSAVSGRAQGVGEQLNVMPLSWNCGDGYDQTMKGCKVNGVGVRSADEVSVESVMRGENNMMDSWICSTD